jgi:DNA-binding response OmpR family regulator
MPLKVVHIDDQPEMLDLIRLILTRAGYEVNSENNGTTGLQTITDILPDVVLLDLMMPEMDGWEVFHSIRANPKTAHIPIIVITARSQSIDKVIGLHIAKVDDYITKPFTGEQVLSSVKRAVMVRKAL